MVLKRSIAYTVIGGMILLVGFAGYEFNRNSGLSIGKQIIADEVFKSF